MSRVVVRESGFEYMALFFVWISSYEYFAFSIEFVF